jgi:hypothetical protein
MTLEELQKIEIPECKHQRRDVHRIRVYYPEEKLKINNIIGDFVFNGFVILEYNAYEMRFNEDYVITDIPNAPNLNGDYFYLHPIKPKKITYLYHTKEQMVDLINELKLKRNHYEKQRKIKEKKLAIFKDFQ